MKTRKNPETVAELETAIAFDLRMEKEMTDALAEEIRLRGLNKLPEGYRSWDEVAFYENESNERPARDDFSPARPLPVVDPGSSGEGHYPNA